MNTQIHKIPSPPPRTGKCLVHTLLLLVIIFIVVLIFGAINTRLKPPSITLPIITVKNLNYKPSDPLWEATLVIHVAIQNRNKFGVMKCEGGAGRVVYANETVGSFLIGGNAGIVRNRGEKEMSVVVVARYGEKGYSIGNGGRVTLGLEIRVRGKVSLIKAFKKAKSAGLNCTMTLDLVERHIQDLLCL